MKYLTTVALGAVSLAAGAAAAKAHPFLNQTVIYQPRAGEELIYPRYVELTGGKILVTSARSAPSPAEPIFPVFSSSNGGKTWEHISNLTDQVNGWGFGAQPALMELTEDIGDYPSGTVLAAGNSWSDVGTRIDVYASADKGKSWKFVSHVAEGGAPNTTNGATPIWEPYLMLYDSQVVCYYSDQRDPEHGQKLAHQTTTDLKKWGSVVNDVAYPTYSDRPGMTVIAHLPNGQWILVHEYPGGFSLGQANYPVYYHLADSPLNFISDPGRPIIAEGFQPSSSPYVVWSSEGGVNGTIVVSDADHNGVFLNTMLGDETGWRYHLTEEPAAYSRAVAIWKDFPDHLAIISGANYNNDPVQGLTISVMDLNVLVREDAPPAVAPQSYYPNPYMAADAA